MPGSGPQSSTAKPIAIGDYTLDVNDSAGSRLAPAPTQTDSRALRRALRREGKDEQDSPSGKLDATVESASEVTSKIEHATSAVEGFTSGALGIGTLNDEADDLLALLGRLSGAKRWQDVVRVARRLSAILSLLERWIELLRSLRAALHAARAADDQLGQAWALHELGTLRLIAGRHAEADRDLGQAREIRERCGDGRGLAATNRNLQVLCQTLRERLPGGRAERAIHRLGRRPALAAAVALTLIAVGGAGGAVLAHSHKREASVLAVQRNVAHRAHTQAQHHSSSGGSGKLQSAVILRCPSGASALGEAVSVSGSIAPARSGVPVRVVYRSPSGEETALTRASNAEGSYTTSFTPEEAGTWSVRSSQAEGGAYRASSSEPCTFVAQAKGELAKARSSTTTTINCPTASSSLGQAVGVSGSITPARAGAPVTLTFAGPSHATTETVQSGPDGSFAASFTPSEEGSWSVESSQPESSEYLGSSSERCVVQTIQLR